MDTKTKTESLRREGQAMQAIADALDPLPDDATRMRVVRAVAALLDIPIDEPQRRRRGLRVAE